MATRPPEDPQLQTRAPRVSLEEPEESYEGPVLEPEESAIGDAIALGWMGQVKDAGEMMGIRPTPGFDPLEHIPEGYEAWASQLSFARSQEELDVRIRNIDENLDIRRRQADRGLLVTLGAEVGGALFDPTTYFGGALTKGASFGTRSIGIAAPSLTGEFARTALDPTDTPAEALLSVTTIGGLSGGFAAAEKVLARRSASRAVVQEAETFSPNRELVDAEALDAFDPSNAQMRRVPEPEPAPLPPAPKPKKPFVPDVSHLDEPVVSSSGRLVREQTIDLGENGGQHYLEYHPEQGAMVKGQVTVDGDGHAIVNINTDAIESAADEANTRGPTAMRDMLDEILEAFPEIKTASVERVTGSSRRTIEADEARVERWRESGVSRRKPKPEPTPPLPQAVVQEPQQFISPIAESERGRVSSGFNERRNVNTPRGRGSKIHKGVDYAYPEGTPIRAPQSGRVTHAGPKGGYGIYVRIEYGDGTVQDGFAHMSEASVQVGDVVKQGDVIGLVGSTGKSTGPHLHWERQVDGKYVDPREALDVKLGSAGAGKEPVYDLGSVRLPESLVVDGRGLRVVDTKDPNVTAGYVRPQTADEIFEEVAEEIRSEAEEVVPPVTLDGGGPRVPDAEKTIPVRHVDVNGNETTRMVPVSEIEAARERAQSRPGPKPMVYDEAKGLTPQQIESLAVRLEERAEALAASAAKHKRANKGRRLMIPSKTRKPTGEEIAQGADPNGRIIDGPLIPAEQRVDQLIERAEEIRAQGTYQDGHFVTDEFGESQWLPGVDRTRPSKVDPDAALLRTTKRIEKLRARYEAQMEAADNAKTQHRQKRHVEIAEGILREIEALETAGISVDRLPYSGTRAADDLHDEHVILNTERLIAEFPNKPWTKWQTPGVEPLPDDAFKDAAEWVQFAALHEVYHSVVARGAKESVAAYENRINKLAMDALERDRTTFKPSRDILEHAAIAPTPRGQLERLIKNPDSPIFESIDRLAGDNAMFTARSRAGAATVKGGSVFQRTELWTRDFAEMRNMLRDHYAQMAQGLPEGASRVSRNLRKGMIPREEFDQRVIRVGLGIGDEADPRIRAAGAELQKIFQKVEAEAADVGLFPGPSRMRAEAAQLRKAADRMEDRFGIVAAGEIGEMRVKANKLDAEADKPILPRGAAGYFPHTYDPSKLIKNEDLALERLTQAFTREGHKNPAKAAREAYAKLLNDDAQVHGGVSKPRYVQHRELPWTDEEAFDFLQTDIEVVMRVYLKRMGAQIEMHRTFGDAHGGAEIERLMDAFDADPDVDIDTALKAVQIWTDARDRVLGQLHGSDPLSMSNRVVRGLKNFGNLVTLGKVAESQIGDVARLVAVQGLGLNFARGNKDAPAGLIQGVVEATMGLKNPADIRIGRLDAKMSGEAWEYAVASTNARMVESDDFLIVQNQSWVEKALAKAQFPFFVANGLIPITVTLKTAAGYAAAHNIVNEAKMLARAVRSGEQIEGIDGIRARLARNGIDELDALIIADMPVEQSPSGMHLIDANIWDEAGPKGQRAHELVRAAVNGEVRRSVMTPGPLDRPIIFDGIFHNRKAQRAAYDAIQKDRDLYEKLREQYKADGTWALEPDDPARVKAQEKLMEISGRITQGYNQLGVAGRKEMPFVSLPFQLKAFAMGAGAKIMKNLFTGPERNKIGGLFGMLAGGMTLAYMRSHAGTTLWEFIVDTLDYASFGAWITDFGKQIDAMGDLQLLGNEFDEEGERYSDEVGAAAGPAIGRIFDAFEGMLNGDIDDQRRYTMIMNAIPFMNLMWLDNSMLSIKDAGRSILFGDQRGAGSGNAFDQSQPMFEVQADMRGRRGIPMTDPRALPEDFEMLDQVEAFEGRTTTLDDGKSGRKSRRWHRGVYLPGDEKPRRWNNFDG